MTRARADRRGLVGTFLAPGLLALGTLVGLVAGLVGDGVLDLFATFALLAPVGAFGQLLRPRRRAPPKALPAPRPAGKSAPHPRSPAPPGAERA